jgi:diguanylate cyclase (GGDEF)-like protein
VSIRVLLLALVLVPLAAVGVSGGEDIAGRVQAAREAEAQSATIRLVGQVDSARAQVESLMLPLIVHGAVENPRLIEQFGISPSVIPLVQAAFPSAALAAEQASSDRQLAAIDLRSLPAPLATAVSALIRQRRRTGTDLAAGSPAIIGDYTTEATLLQQLGQAEDDVTSALLSDPGIGGARSDVQQLQLVVSLVGWADDEMPAFLSTAVASTANPARQATYLQVWAAYHSAATAATGGLRGPLGARWAAIEHDPGNTSFDAAVDPTTRPAAAPGLSTLVSLASASASRTTALDGLLQQAISRAVGAVAAQRDGAWRQVWSGTGVTGGLIAGCLLLVLIVGRLITRPVRRLADQADRIRQGELVEVVPGGPTEVRRAGEALQEAAAGLRRVEEQASELAAGRLDSPLLREALPGPLGAAVHGSVTRIIEAIHERERLQSELAHQAAHDPLTSLPNRAAALAQTEAALARAARAEQLLGVLFVDLDGFKAVNDAHGHAAGDRTLQVVAERMCAAVRTGDAVCRLGGDEFLVIIEDADSELAIVEAAQRVIEAVSRPFAVGGDELAVGASVGVAVAADARSTADSLLAEADAAVYRAKEAGGGRVEVFDAQLRAVLGRRADLERGLREGLRRGEFALVYQPVVDLLTSTVHSHEALLRWNRPGRGEIMPAEFIPVAESCGLINDLGRWVLREATDQVRRWTDELGGPGRLPSVAVNVSGCQLASDGLVDDVRQAIEASGIAPSQLTLELTESVLVADLRSIDRLHDLKALGVRVALDDFGTGYTSIGQLGRFPVDILKIDRSFVSMLATSDKLVQTMIQVAHTFSLDVVAEGVEDLEQLTLLRDLDCDAVQGYLFARPQPAEVSAGPGETLPVREPLAPA